jgi:translocation and assembly module TamB
MASEEPKRARPASLPRRRLWPRLLLAFGAIVLALLATLGWLTGSESGTRKLLSLAGSFTGGQMQAQGVRGSLLRSPLHLDSLVLQQANARITLNDIDLDWQPSALLHSALRVHALRIGRVLIDSKPASDEKPPVLPDSIAAPLRLQVERLRIERGALRRDGAQALAFGPLDFALNFDGQRYRLDLAQLSVMPALSSGSASANLSGTLALSTGKPYPLQGSFASRGQASLEGRSLAANGRVSLGGSLERLDTGIDFALNQMQLKGQAQLQPFAAQPLGAAELELDAFDLAQFGAQLPQTALDARLRVTKDGSGTLVLRNRNAGLYDQRKLPLASLDADFRQSGERIEFERIHALLGKADAPAGELAGSGVYAGDTAQLTLQTDRLDLKRLAGNLRATRLAGRVELRQTGDKREFLLAANEPLGTQRLLLDAHGVLDQTGLTLDRAELQAGKGRASVTAKVGFDGDQPFRAEGSVNNFRLRDLGNFPQVPSLELTGAFSARGARAPKLQAELSFEIRDSLLAGQPLHGKGEVLLRDERLRVPQLALTAGANRLQASGELAQADSRLVFDLNASRLDQIGPQFAGALQVKGVATGTLDRPRLQADWSARDAHLPGQLQIDGAQGRLDATFDQKQPLSLASVSAALDARGLRAGANRLGSLSAQLRFAPRPDAPLSLTLQAQNIDAGQLRARRFDASADGSTARHRIEAKLQETGQDWRMLANGGLDRLREAPRWQGKVEQFTAQGRFNAHLLDPAALLLSTQQVSLEGLVLDAESGRIAVEQFARDDKGLRTRGRIVQLKPGLLLPYLDPAPPVKTDLQLSGEWDVRMVDTLEGKLALRRDSGDLTVLGSTPVALGLETLSIEASADAGRAVLRLALAGSRSGRIALEADTRIGDGANRLALAPDAPLSGRLQIDVPSLRWIAPLVSPTLIVDGSLQSQVALAGTAGDPRLTGRIDGRALRLTMADLGIDLRRGTLQSEFRGEQLQLQNLSFESAQGRLALSGPIDLGGGDIAADLKLVAQRFTLLDRVDRRLTLSGESGITYRDKRAAVRGGFTVDSGAIDIGQADAPHLSDDVVIVGREEKKGPSALGLALDVTVDLGDGIALTGRGLDATLVGKVRLASQVGEPPQAFGELRIAKGTFSAYGRELAIERGLLRFTGPLDNPSLDILAMRRNQRNAPGASLTAQTVDAGVSVRGNVLAPRITLVSEPNVPDAEKLSWLVLGHGLASATPSDASSLQSAAASMLSAGAASAVTSRIAGAIGLDTLSVGTSDDSLQQRIVTLGKQVSSRLYVSYQQALQGAGGAVLLRYLLTPRLSVEAEAGSRSAISLFYNILFD